MKGYLEGARGIFLVVLFVFCGAAYVHGEVPALQGKDPAEKARVQKLIDGARAEGKLVWLGNMIEFKMGKHVWEGFKAFYDLPKMNLEHTYSMPGQAFPQVEQSIQAKRVQTDVVWFVAWAWYRDLMARGYIMRYDSPMYKEYVISHKVGNSMPGYWVSDGYTFSPMWNPAALEKAGVRNFHPASWWDFTDPKLGKYTSMGNIPRGQSFVQVSQGLRRTLGDEWFKKMAKLKPALFTPSAQGRDWCASGEYPIDIFSHAKNAEQVKAAGVDVKLLYPKEGVVMLPFAPIILTAAPHPNAAKLFIDYVRSEAGTNRIAESGAGLLYGRPGVKAPPSEFLPPAEKINAIPMDWNAASTTQAVQEITDWVIGIELSY